MRHWKRYIKSFDFLQRAVHSEAYDAKLVQVSRHYDVLQRNAMLFAITVVISFS